MKAIEYENRLMKQLYCDTLFNGLVPVTDVKEDTSGWYERLPTVEATVKADTGPYKKGEVTTLEARYLVEKVRVNRDGFIMVRTVPIKEQ